MKTLLKSLAVALTIGIVTSTASFANPGGRAATVASYQSAVYTTASGKLSIALDKQKGGAVDVRLKDNGGQVLYSQRITRNERQYRSRLNLTDLPDGVYQVEITNGVEKTTHNVTLSTQKPEKSSRVIAMN